MIVGRVRLHVRFAEAGRLRDGVGVEHGLGHRIPARPESDADDFVRARVAHERRAFAWRRRFAEKRRDRQIEAPQKKCTGLHLPTNPQRRPREDTGDLARSRATSDLPTPDRRTGERCLART